MCAEKPDFDISACNQFFGVPAKSQNSSPGQFPIFCQPRKFEKVLFTFFQVFFGNPFAFAAFFLKISKVAGVKK